MARRLDKPLVWLGGEIKTPPLSTAARIEAGVLLRRLQMGNLARRLRDVRENRGSSQEAMAKLLGSSQSRVAKMEAGDRSVSVDLLVRALLLVGASRAEIAREISRRAA